MFYMQSVTLCFLFNAFYNYLLLSLGLINLILNYNNNPPIFLPPFFSIANSSCIPQDSSSWTKLSSGVSLRYLQCFPTAYSPYPLAWCSRLSTSCLLRLSLLELFTSATPSSFCSLEPCLHAFGHAIILPSEIPSPFPLKLSKTDLSFKAQPNSFLFADIFWMP